MRINTVVRDSSVGIATRYGLDGPGIESWWGRDFPHQSRLALGPTQSPIQWVLRLSQGVKWAGNGVDYPPPSSAEVKERAGLYLYNPLWALVACSRVQFATKPDEVLEQRKKITCHLRSGKFFHDD